MFGQGVTTDAVTELIRGLKADGVWDKTELICVVRGSEIASLTNLKNAANIGANVGGCAFTPYRGFTVSDTGGKYIDSNITLGGAISADSNHLWAYTSNTNPPVGWSSQGVVGASRNTTNANLSVRTINAATDTNASFNGSVGLDINADTPVGFFGIARDSSTSMAFRINATASTSATANTTTALPGKIFVGAINVNGGAAFFSDCRVQGWGWGSGLTATELGNLRTRIQTYMTAIGAQA